MTRVAILGAGSWGTAVALHIAKQDVTVLLWTHEEDHATQMQKTRLNQRFLPNIPLPENIHICHDLSTAVASADTVIVAVPSHAFIAVVQAIPKPKNGLAWLTKGIDPTTRILLSEWVHNQWGKDFPIAVIAGPSFATEVANGLPTALVVAGNHPSFLETIRTLLHFQTMRVYLSKDWIGVQLCGTIKNVLAIACGMSDGLHYGANAKAALITRGLAEMTRLGLALGAHTETFMGLAGIGDLVLTCTDNQSRNRRFGLLLSEGMSIEAAESKIGQVVEGKNNSAQVCALAQTHHISMPICEEVHRVLTGVCTPEAAAQELMQRPTGRENE